MKKCVYHILFLSFMLASCVPTIRYNSDKKENNKANSIKSKNTAYKTFSSQSPIGKGLNKARNITLESEARKWIGTPYKWGGISRRGVDCSAFVQNVYKNIGVNLPRTAHQQFESSLIVNRSSRKAGDLIFFKKNGKSSRGNVTHVGIYLGNGKLIHSSTKKGVIIQDVDNSYLGRRYFAVGRVL